MKASDYANSSPREVRQLIREGKWTLPTPGLCKGHVQGNLVVLPRDLAYDFLVFAQRNPKPCPILDVTEPGDPEPKIVAPGADISTDIPRYRVWKDGVCVDEPTDVKKYWRDDLVGFLLGCSFSFEGALLEAGIPVRHIEQNRNVPMYVTNIQCTPAGALNGPVVVSMRPIPAAMVPKAVLCTGRFPAVHGSPIHIGDPSQIGIADVNKLTWATLSTSILARFPSSGRAAARRRRHHGGKAPVLHHALAGAHVRRRPEGRRTTRFSRNQRRVIRYKRGGREASLL